MVEDQRRFVIPSPKLGEGARRAGEVCINRLATTAEWQAVGIYRSWLVTPFEQKFCARSAHPTRPARNGVPRSQIGGVHLILVVNYLLKNDK